MHLLHTVRRMIITTTITKNQKITTKDRGIGKEGKKKGRYEGRMDGWMVVWADRQEVSNAERLEERLLKM